jgi:hypothetical protein
MRTMVLFSPQEVDALTAQLRLTAMLIYEVNFCKELPARLSVNIERHTAVRFIRSALLTLSGVYPHSKGIIHSVVCLHGLN